MRMLFVSRPGFGHLLPLLPIAIAARDAGHDVRIATGAAEAETSKNLGFATEIVGADFGNELRQELQAGSVPRAEIRKFAFTQYFAGKELEPRIADLQAKCFAVRPDVVVHEVAELASPIVAMQAGIPYATVGFGPLLAPDVADAVGDVIAPAWRARNLPVPKWGGLYRLLYIDPCPPGLQIAAVADLPAVQLMGRGQPDAQAKPGWLAEVSAPLVYVTFGTIFNRNHGLFRTILEALARLPVEVVVTVGKNNNPADFGPQPKTTRIFQFVPQDDLLPHCSAVVMHGGSGTLLGTLAFGVPALLMPQSADQFYNASRAEHAGVALSLAPEQTSSEAIQNSVAKLLNDPCLAEEARKVAVQMAAMPSPREAVARIVRLKAEPTRL